MAFHLVIQSYHITRTGMIAKVTAKSETNNKARKNVIMGSPMMDLPQEDVLSREA